MPKTILLTIAFCAVAFVSFSGEAHSVGGTYPDNPQAVANLLTSLEKSVYGPVIREWRNQSGSLSKDQIEKLWRMGRKAHWRDTDQVSLDSFLAERRIKILTQKNWKAFQWGGEEENADPAAPFEIQESDARPKGMPAGSYALNSGQIGHWYPSTLAMLRNEDPVKFEIEFQQVAKDGRIMVQRKTTAEADESLGWDGRFEFQPLANGKFEIVLTQGAMELPVNLIGAAPDAPLEPRVSENNEFRSRHIFHLREWISGTHRSPPKLVVRDEGSVLGFHPTIEKRYIQVDRNGRIQHAHGYGENFLPDFTQANKPWLDEKGDFWRVFDMVTKETTIERHLKSGELHYDFIPTETRAVAVKMDRKNPGIRDLQSPFIFVTSNQLPGTVQAMPTTMRYAFDTRGKAIEQRWVNQNGTVTVMKAQVPQNAPALLNEGLNFAECTAQFSDGAFYIATNSSGEYTSGGLPAVNQKFYGTYLWYRPVSAGRVGAYLPLLNDAKSDAKDIFREITQMYGASWGIGRTQLFGKQGSTLWAKAHMVDVDLLPEDPLRFPPSGYPADNAVFTNAYRRHQIEIPVEFVEERGLPSIRVADPEVQADLVAWRARRKNSSAP